MPEKLEEYHEQYELVNGREVMMSPARTEHNRIQGNLYGMIWNFLRGKRCVLFSEEKVVFDEDNHFVPDLMIVCDRSKIKENHVEGAPDLVIEILSISTRKRDFGIKKNVYEKYGVKEYWIVDPRAKSIQVYCRMDGKLELNNVYTVPYSQELEALTEEEREKLTLSLKVGLYDDFVIDVGEVFRDIE